VRGIYEAFARQDIPAILNPLDQQIDWRAPDNLPHGGHFTGRDQVGRFFQGIGEHWETLTVEIDDLLSSDKHVVVLARIKGRLRSTGEATGYSAAHAWTVHDGTAVRFAETVDAPLTLPAAAATAHH
jgi:ketosteroid isomerase-like protein